jgi:hypothetical protein
MKEKFTNAMVTCAAIAMFVGSGAAVVNGMSSIMDYKVTTVLVQRQANLDAAKLAAEQDSSLVDATVTGVKKLVKSLN